MRFVILYRNRDDIRQNVVELIKQGVLQGFNFAIGFVNHPIFRAQPFWPNPLDLDKLDLTTQCEEVEYKEGAVISIRQLVIDVEVKKEETQISQETYESQNNQGGEVGSSSEKGENPAPLPETESVSV